METELEYLTDAIASSDSIGNTVTAWPKTPRYFPFDCSRCGHAEEFIARSQGEALDLARAAGWQIEWREFICPLHQA